ncbi:MAG: NAD(+) diphosphatase [Pseudomonadota bacterium]|nr:NAD(+) diphosphatase [Pseudomonadota bacterium]
MLVADGEIKTTEGSRHAIAWLERHELALHDAEAFWVSLGCIDGRDHYAAIRIGQARAAEAAAFRPARQPGFASLFQLGRSSPAEQQFVARALHMSAWLHRSRYCGTCGAAAAFITDLNKRVCTNEACRHELFPRIEPAIITLVTAGGKCLLARQAMFPKGYYAPLAGFVEAGETPEHAVAREVFEETGQLVRQSHYVAAQPWPFPGALMLGFIAHVEVDQPILLSDELEGTVWADRAQIREAIATPGVGALLLPPPGVIGRQLIDHWMADIDHQ